MKSEGFPDRRGLGHRARQLSDANPNRPAGDMDRRQFLIASSALAGAGAASVFGVIEKFVLENPAPAVTMPPRKRQAVAHHAEKEKTPVQPGWWKDVWYTTPKVLVGKSIDRDLGWRYIKPDPELNSHEAPEIVETADGPRTRFVTQPAVTPNSLPASLPPIAFHQNLTEMLQIKKDLAGDDTFYDKVASSYANLWETKRIRQMSLAEFKDLTEQERTTVLGALDPHYDDLVRVYLRPQLGNIRDEERLKTEKALAACLRYAMQHVTSDMILATMMTEIMPSPAYGVALFEFLTKSAGVEFPGSLPAIGDRVKSLGPLQLTPYTVGPRGSITAMLKHLHLKELLPDTLNDFTNVEDHMRAGFLNSALAIVLALQTALKRGKPEEVVAFVKTLQEGELPQASTVFGEYIAATHHRPKEALPAFMRALEARRGGGTPSNTLVTYFQAANDNQQETQRYAAKDRDYLLQLDKMKEAA